MQMPHVARKKKIFAWIIVAFGVLVSTPRTAQALPPGFEQTMVASELALPTAMEFAPDGRLFVSEKGGTLRVIKNGKLLESPFTTLTVDDSKERGLLGIAFDPQYSQNRWLYVFYSRQVSPSLVYNQVSRFTASSSNPDVADPSSEKVLLQDVPHDGGIHNGGAIHFGRDGKLYISMGENAVSKNAQDLTKLKGKILRINKDGSVPADNPFVGQKNIRPEIWALGFRNPYTFAVDPGTGRTYINDVGKLFWEEINVLARGANYGWPGCEGKCLTRRYKNPLYAYHHKGHDAAISGSAFYRAKQFPAKYFGSYFFADYVKDVIEYLDVQGRVRSFAATADGPVDLKVGPDGNLYYASILQGRVYKILYQPGNRTPVAQITANTSRGVAPLTVSFQAKRSRDPDGSISRYTWDFGDGGSVSHKKSVTHTYGKNGAYHAQLTIQDNKGARHTVRKTIAVGHQPVGQIVTPVIGATYTGSQVINFSGQASDVDDGILPVSAYRWQVVLRHGSHSHPVYGPISSTNSGEFSVPALGETATNVFYRVYLTVTDADGLSHQSSRDIRPVVSTLVFKTQPAGLKIKLDGEALKTPVSVRAVAGLSRRITAPTQTFKGKKYILRSWSNGGAASHDIIVAPADQVLKATFQVAP